MQRILGHPSFPAFKGQPFAVCFLVFIREIHSSCMHALCKVRPSVGKQIGHTMAGT